VSTKPDADEPRDGPKLSSVALGQRTGYLVIKLGELALQAAEDVLEPLGLRARQFNVLAMAGAGTSLSQQELSALLGIDKTLIVGVIDELEDRGLVVRRRGTEDRRRYTLEVTPRGRRLLKEAYDAIEAGERELFATLSARERTQLRDMVTRVLAPRWPVKKPT
jgi:DNA-binding MarR family transcriptional regulator